MSINFNSVNANAQPNFGARVITKGNKDELNALKTLLNSAGIKSKTIEIPHQTLSIEAGCIKPQSQGGENLLIITTGNDIFQSANTNLILEKSDKISRNKFVKSLYKSAVTVAEGVKQLIK